MTNNWRGFLALAGTALLMAVAPDGHAGPLADWLQARRDGGQQSDGGEDLSDLGGGQAMSCADWSRKVGRLQKLLERRHTGPAPTLKDQAYGGDKLETLDVYLPAPSPGASAAPVIVMVHGGGWCVGDKAAPGVTENKVVRWVDRGFAFVSVNYPMVSEGADALAQASEVAKAVAFVQAHARAWGADPTRVVLMGHSAGAHLVSLVDASEPLRRRAGMGPVLATVSLDAGAIDVVRQMPMVYPFLKVRYREAFGETEAEWIAASPFHQLDRQASPWLGVCSTTRKDDPCGQAQAYADKRRQLGLRAAVLPEAMNHGAINKQLGEAGAYTTAVESFLAGLDPVVAGLLGGSTERETPRRR